MKCPNLWQDLHWYFCWTLERFYMYRIITFLISLPVLINVLGIKTFLLVFVVWSYWWSVTSIILVTGWSRFHKRLLLLGFAWWEICVLVSHQINLCHLGAACNLLDMSDSCLWTFHLLSKLPDLACWKIVKVHIAIIDYLGDKFFILKEEPKISLWNILAVSQGSLAKATWVWTALYHLPTELFPWWKLVRRSNLALTSFDWGLQNSSNLSQPVSGVSSSVDKLQETYWSMPAKIAIPSNYFLAFSSLRYHHKLTFPNIFTFKSPLQESMV